MESNSTWDSIKSLVSPKTIPFLISQGVVPKLLPVGTLLLGIILAFVWAYLLFPTAYTGAAPVNLESSQKQEYIKQVAWQLQATGNQDAAKKALDALGDAKTQYDQLVGKTTDPALKSALQPLQPLAQNNPTELSKVQPGLLNNNLMPFLCVIVTAILIGGAVVVNTIIPITLLFRPKSKERATVTSGQEAARRKAMAHATNAAPPPPLPPQPPIHKRAKPPTQYV